MWLCSRLLVGFMSPLCVFHSATEAYLGVIFAWFRAGIHINQTTHAHVKPGLIWFVISNHIQWSKQVTRSVPKSVMRRGIHTLYNHKKAIQDGKGSIVNRQYYLPHDICLVILCIAFEYLTYQIQNVL